MAMPAMLHCLFAITMVRDHALLRCECMYASLAHQNVRAAHGSTVPRASERVL